jgi:peroxiredoxin
MAFRKQAQSVAFSGRIQHKETGIKYCINYLDPLDNALYKRFIFDGNVMVDINYRANSADINHGSSASETGGMIYSVVNLVELIKNTINDEKITYELFENSDSVDGNCYKFFIHDTTGSSILAYWDKHLINCYVWIDRNTFYPVRYCRAREDGFDSVVYRNIFVNRETTGRMNAIDSIPSGFDRFEKFEVQETTLNKGEYRYWKLPAVQNDTVDLTYLKGKIVLMDFSYVNCPACIQSIPLLNKLSTEFSSDEVVVLGVNPINKDLSVLDNFISKYNIQFKILLDKDKSVSDAYLINSFPTLYVLDKSGNVITGYVGYNKDNDDKIAELIRKYL